MKEKGDHRWRELVEMTPGDCDLLFGSLRRMKPRKVLEVGVSAGATTLLMLEELPGDSEMHSVDLETQWYTDPSMKTGFVALERYNASRHPRWVHHFGQDVSYCIDKIGKDIDFLLLDTTHLMPGEFLSYLAALPYLSDEATVFLHDIGLHALARLSPDGPWPDNCHCTGLLFNALHSANKSITNDIVPNAGVAVINREESLQHSIPVMNMLFLDWDYLPPISIITKTLRIVNAHYPTHAAALFEKAVEYHLRKFNVDIPG